MSVLRAKRLRSARRRPVAVLLGGGTATGFIGLHALHLAGVAAAPIVLDFLCRLPH